MSKYWDHKIPVDVFHLILKIPQVELLEKSFDLNYFTAQLRMCILSQRLDVLSGFVYIEM